MNKMKKPKSSKYNAPMITI